ncbi:MAG: hypothetical protein COT43_05635 [Candidatus Marinimicrobia bacterium CG08_land_8_20_14_0_20_45_22]|nr:MAG: hypothetical protein COT43_05635 [Candidatus Marinimicrobia bacterium CG08_land_8_20_14_0_20_45_22]
MRNKISILILISVLLFFAVNSANSQQFTEMTEISLTEVMGGSAAWGDYDNDGDLDILLTGYTSSDFSVSKIYRNNGDNSFTEQTGISLTGVYYSSVAWGDYDNDGNLDILLTGEKYSSHNYDAISKIYHNNGDNSFTEQTGISLTGVENSSVAWGDYDNDGDLDILLTGFTGSSNTYVTKIYCNNNLITNSTPLAPSGLTATTTGSDVTFSWNKSSDTETPQNGLTYNLYVSTTSGGCQVKSPMADSSTGYRKVVQLGNMNHCNSYTLKGLTDGKYYWSVQAIDNAFAGSSWATEYSFIIDTTSPSAPQNLTVQPGNGQVILKWNKNIESDFLRYRIYSGTSANPTIKIDSTIGGILDTIKVITGLTNGTTYYFRITAVDSAGNESGFSNQVSAIPDDYEAPQVALLSPVGGEKWEEGSSQLIKWISSDNVRIQHHLVHFSIDNGQNFTRIDSVSGEVDSLLWTVSNKITKQGKVKVTSYDARGNSAFAVNTNPFEIVDITPPNVMLISQISGKTVEIANAESITWTATDNAGVQFIDLDYSVNGGTDWKPIAAHESNDGSYDWLIPDEQSENCKIRVIATDGVGLSDTSISAGAFTIVRIYPKLAAFPSVLSPLDTLVLEFTQAMDSAGFRSGCALYSQMYGDLTYHYRFYDNLRKAKLFLTESFTSRDTLSVLMTANSTTNIYGYGLDGNANGGFEGSPTDNLTLTIPVEIAGDFNNDDVVNFDDFAPFVLAWQGRDFGKELAPNRGEVPRITISPNQKYDVYDLTTFASLWNWTVGLRKALPMIADFPEVDFPVTQEGNSVMVKPNSADVIAYQYLVEYDPKVVGVKYSDNRLPKITETQMRMVDAFPDSGLLLISEGYFSASALPEMHLELLPKGRNPYEITIAYQTVLTDCTRVIGKRTIRLQPIPTKFALQQNYPNPFNPTTTIPYQLPEKAYVRISIYNLNGQFVETIVSKEQPAGYYSVVWNAGNVASGIYIYRIEAGSFHDVRKCAILK